MDAARLDEILSAESMTRGGIVGREGPDSQERRERQNGRERRKDAAAVARAPAFLPALPAQPAKPAKPAKPKGRLFEARDLGLLEAPDRDQWQKPDQIMDALGIADGSIVADLAPPAAGSPLRLARRVGPNGRVYAEDIQPLMIEAIAQRMQSENLSNVDADSRYGERSAPAVGSRCGDHLGCLSRDGRSGGSHAGVTLLKNIARSLKPQGKLGIVDWTAGNGGPGPAADQRVDPNTIIRAARAAGCS